MLLSTVLTKVRRDSLSPWEREHTEFAARPERVSTFYAERQNLTMRMQMRRFTRLTNAFSKKFENHMHMVALYTVWYNYVKQHKASRVFPRRWLRA